MSGFINWCRVCGTVLAGDGYLVCDKCQRRMPGALLLMLLGAAGFVAVFVIVHHAIG